jgi:uncharacterized protein YbjT (DUF2867 family)
MITVMGATGQVGGAITRLLLASGETVRALGRSESKLTELRKLGAETRAGDVGDSAFLIEVFQGADAVFTLLPHDPTTPGFMATQDEYGVSIVKALRDSGVPYAVALSSIGAEVPSGTGFIESLYLQEQRLRTLTDTQILLLRPGYFFENFYASLELIKNEGINGDSIAPDTSIPMIATQDVAEAGARALTKRDWNGIVVQELLGPRDLSPAEVTRILGEKIGNPDLPYTPFADADLIAALTGVGISEDFARLVTEANRAMNEGTIHSVEGRNAANTTPTRFEDFAEELAFAYRAL